MTRAVVLSLALLFAACGSPTQSTSSPFTDDRVLTANALHQAQAEWAVHGPARYSALVTRYCYCGLFLKRVRIVVERGVVISAQAEDGTAANPTDFPSVEQQFALLSEAVNTHASAIQVAYNSDLVYPVAIYVDRSAQTSGDEQGFETKELKPLP